jgi:hypothetical protein
VRELSDEIRGRNADFCEHPTALIVAVPSEQFRQTDAPLSKLSELRAAVIVGVFVRRTWLHAHRLP